MTDIYTKKKRSEIMSKISNKETKPEILVGKYLSAKGFHCRKNVSNLPGKPDLVLPKRKIAIFVHGCFWHGHTKCKAATLPKTKKSFWKNKIYENKDRDKKNIKKLKQKGFKVIIIWQCKINNKTKQLKRLKSLVGEIKKK